ncbi:hypothetical protein L873DRAFT_812757 [Choiromyces venosus 120613-1]|uniref:Uncharacterized protein n=1 Tax=Choiromyces venosus 120613-1 TaxID=1336337 RepID=A0A3N4JQ60_9PEZI|nr:hypothetical protein L873DRAFT_812757 [Choiromyces venosus 120613-1]
MALRGLFLIERYHCWQTSTVHASSDIVNYSPIRVIVNRLCILFHKLASITRHTFQTVCGVFWPTMRINRDMISLPVIQLSTFRQTNTFSTTSRSLGNSQWWKPLSSYDISSRYISSHPPLKYNLTKAEWISRHHCLLLLVFFGTRTSSDESASAGGKKKRCTLASKHETPKI